MRNPAMGEGATLFEAELSAKSAAVRDALMDLLLGDDEQQSLRELERVSLTIATIIAMRSTRKSPASRRSRFPNTAPAAAASWRRPPISCARPALRRPCVTRRSNHLRMVLVDEAFSKMDEMRLREVIDYPTRSLGLQLIFIMPTSKCGPFMDLISNEFVFAKVPSAPCGQLNTRVLVDRKECNRERIGELWARNIAVRCGSRRSWIADDGSSPRARASRGEVTSRGPGAEVAAGRGRHSGAARCRPRSIR